MKDEPIGEQATLTTDTVECKGVCGRKVYEPATVDVVVGKVTDTYQDGTVGVAGVDVSHPEVEQWCTQCAQDEFRVQRPAGERSVEHTNKYLTPSNIAAFLSGVLVMLTVASVIVL